MKRKPDFLFLLITAFGVAVLFTVLVPMTANTTVAAPASELQAGIIINN